MNFENVKSILEECNTELKNELSELGKEPQSKNKQIKMLEDDILLLSNCSQLSSKKNHLELQERLDILDAEFKDEEKTIESLQQIAKASTPIRSFSLEKVKNNITPLLFTATLPLLGG